jgi:uncharacterized protein YbjT (DUF2867 family)
MRSVLVIGGSGFVGRHLVQRLAEQDLSVIVPTRRRERAKELLVLPTVDVVTADVHDPATLKRLVRYSDAVVNLVGVLRGGNGRPYGPGFRRAHVDLPQNIATAMRAAGVRRLLHMSALQAAADAPSGYLRSKHDGEAAVLREGIDATVFRPSVIFGRGDSFLSLFAGLLRVAPVLPLVCPEARFQPVWVEDVAFVMARALDDIASVGRCYELCGPRQYALRELFAYVAGVTGRRRAVVGLPDALSLLQAALLEWLPGGPMSRDNYYSMQRPSVCAANCTLPFSRKAAALEDIAPSYLAPPPPHPGPDRYRRFAGR